MNPHLTSSPLGLFSLPYHSINLATRLAHRPELLNAPTRTPFHLSLSLHAGHTPPGLIHDAVRWLAPVIDLCNRTAQEVLENGLRLRGPNFLFELGVANEVELLGSFLHSISIVGSFNLTATRAISQWLSTALANTTTAFGDLRMAVEALREATQLRTGQSMTAIWQSLLSAGPNDQIIALGGSLTEALRLAPFGSISMF